MGALVFMGGGGGVEFVDRGGGVGGVFEDV